MKIFSILWISKPKCFFCQSCQSNLFKRQVLLSSVRHFKYLCCHRNHVSIGGSRPVCLHSAGHSSFLTPLLSSPHLCSLFCLFFQFNDTFLLLSQLCLRLQTHSYPDVHPQQEIHFFKQRLHCGRKSSTIIGLLFSTFDKSSPRYTPRDKVLQTSTQSLQNSKCCSSNDLIKKENVLI